MRVHHIWESTTFAFILDQHDSLEGARNCFRCRLGSLTEEGMTLVGILSILTRSQPRSGCYANSMGYTHTHRGRPTNDDELGRKTFKTTTQQTLKQQFIYLWDDMGHGKQSTTDRCCARGDIKTGNTRHLTEYVTQFA
jgi:hypothetical protein